MSSNLVVPLVMWGKNAPTHCICSILLTPDEKHIVTGCNDGQIVLWNMAEDWKVRMNNFICYGCVVCNKLNLGIFCP
jgi:WD40 repeat protein